MQTLDPTLTNGILRNPVIRRKGSGNYSYSRKVHRDLDEQGVRSFWQNQGLAEHFNFWIPLLDVKNEPIALCVASSVLPGDQSAWCGIDKTGLKYSKLHEWVYYPDLKPGDLLAWRSNWIYHGALDLNIDDSERISVDFRMSFA